MQYTYTQRNQIDKVINGRLNKIDYDYYSWGGLHTVKYYTNAADETADRTVTYNYDGNGNIVDVSDTAVQSGPLYGFSYDPENRLDITTVNYLPGGSITLNNSCTGQAKPDTFC